ncbi:MAG: pilus assembly protein [Shinella sp.]|nr:pilus assembly protein [Shinella sp.]
MLGDGKAQRRHRAGLMRRFFLRRDGAAAIEFALLSIPFFVIVFASIETFIAFSAEQLLANANDTMARKIRTGEITFNQNRPATDMTAQAYRAAFCEEVSILRMCSEDEVGNPKKLFIDVRSFSSFSGIPDALPIKDSDLDTTAFAFAPGGKKTINVVRAYYRWDIMTDLIRPYITSLRPADGSSPPYLMVATEIVQSENYP